ncbi:hypothetical protein GON03_07290 [Nocardioides sp. MAH-18]|uniref:Phage baseplate protein n=1 Tax=Nocardioides agri TaxID=2682843 RepID=A0A6L6XQA2_9ACTN|nr:MULTISPECIES: hypothetical protein [unclassified Nocardioides]MBA2954120.1 hypothetical protein [Nocardioides sp. CGMCC 1.13656]MVQ48982.1 hypothetical protein [Nocardioides sp. MAH-18]
MSLLVALDGPAAARVTLGTHHRELLALHRDLLGTTLEAVVTCRHCGTDSEFPVPAEAVLDLPAPVPGNVVAVEVGGARETFRLPTVEDLDATRGLAYDDAVRRLAVRTHVGGAAPALDSGDIARLTAAWDEADPAGDVTVDVDCVGCGVPLAVSVDPAEFVARDLDRFLDRLVREVHALATAYGWTEDAILALPTSRRRRYLELVDTRAAARSLTAVSS